MAPLDLDDLWRREHERRWPSAGSMAWAAVLFLGLFIAGAVVVAYGSM